MKANRQQLRAEARKQAFQEVTAKYGLEPRRARRRIARRLAKTRWARLTVAMLAFAVLGTPQVQAQGTRKDDIVLNARGTPQGGASVAVCTQPAVTTSTPCSPLANLFSNPQLTQALVNPLTTDGLGNYAFYAAPGKYTIQIYGPAITTKVIPDVALPNDPSSPSFTTITTTSGISAFSLTLTGNLTVNGSASVTLGLSAATVTLSNQGTPPGAPAAGNVIVYTKTSDKKLYFKDETGLETGPLGAGGGSLSSNNIWTGSNQFNADVYFKSGRPVYDVMAFGASGSNQSTTGSITTGTATLTLAAAKDFVNGQGIAVYGAGAVSALAAPTGLTVTPTATTFYVPAGNVTRATNVVTIKYTTPHFYAVGQSITLAGMSDSGFNGTFTVASTPDAWTTTHAQTAANATAGSGTVVLAAGASANTYRVAAIDASGGLSAPTSAVSTTTSQSTLSASGFNRIKWNAVAGAIGYAVYGRTGTITAIAMARREDTGEATSQWDDFGNSFTPPAYVPNALPAGATNQVLLTTISAGGGTTTLTLAANASATVSGVAVQHDDTAAIQAAQNLARNNGGIVYFPIGTHNFWNVDITTLGSPASFTVWQFDGVLSPRIPLVMKSYVALVGGMQLGGTTPFGYPGRPRSAVLANSLNPVIAVRGLSNPSYIGNVFIPGHPGDGIRLSSKDAANVVDNVLIENVATTATNPPGGSGIRIDSGAAGVGGFGYTIRDSSISMTANTGIFPSIWMTTAAIVQVSNSIVIGSGIRMDGANFTTAIIGAAEFTNIETENLATPFLMVDGTGGAVEQFTLNRIELADNIMTPNQALICNLASTVVNSFTVTNSRGWNGPLTSGDNIRGLTSIGGITDGGLSGPAGIGTGAGLSYTIQAHNGNFIYNSMAIGQGAVFGDNLPLANVSLYAKAQISSSPAAIFRGIGGGLGDIVQFQDTTANAVLARFGVGGTDRLSIADSAGTIKTTFSDFAQLNVRQDGLTTALKNQGLLTVGAFAGVPGLIIGPASGSQDSMQIFHTGSSTSKIFAVDSGDNTLIKRVKASQGTALGAGDFALSAGWGTGATVTGVTGTDQGWQMTVTAAGTPAANPSVTLTFKDGTWTNAPICVSKMVGGTGAVTQLTEAPAATTNTLTFQGTPVAASTYILASVCMGR